MADTKRDTMQQDAAAMTPAAQGETGRAGEEESPSSARSSLSLRGPLIQSGAKERQTQSPAQEQSGPTIEPDACEGPAEAARFAAASGPQKGKNRSRRHRKVCTGRKGAGEARQKVMMGLIPVLAIALVFVVKNPLKVSAVTPDQDAQTAGVAPIVSSNIEIDWKIPPLYLPGSRDPMQLPPPPPTAATEEDGPAPAPLQVRIDLTVSGILYSPDRPAAIVDTQLVHEGEQISGATVKKIEMDGVEFEMNGQTWKQVVENQ